MEQHSTTIGNIRLEWGRLERQDRRQRVSFRRAFGEIPVVLVSVENDDARAVETVEVVHEVRRRHFRVTSKENYTVTYVAIGRARDVGGDSDDEDEADDA